MALLIWFTWLCAQEIRHPMNTAKGLIQYLYSLLSIVFLSSFINLMCGYSLFQLIDPDYKYELAETQYMRLHDHRMEKGLPPPRPLSHREIEEKYTLAGLLRADRAVYVINVMVVCLLFPVAILFSRLSPGNR
jgi:hypothetical protein